MAKFSRTQIEVMARAAGWGARSRDASWVAMAESGGHSETVNQIQCVGLMQINQPVFIDAHPKWTIEYLKDPMNNLRAALVIFKNAANSFDGPWADSKHKGGIPEGWGPHVSKEAGGGSSAAQTADDDPCAKLKGPAKEYCKRSQEEQTYPPDAGQGDGTSLLDTAAEIGRLAQAVAKAGNWLANPANWVRIAYVVGGGVLAITAVDVIIRPAMTRGGGTLGGTLPGKAVKAGLARRRANVEASKQEGSE